LREAVKDYLQERCFTVQVAVTPGELVNAAKYT